MGITVDASGSFANTVKLLRRLSSNDIFNILTKYGPIGVQALADGTPSESGETAAAWSYKIEQDKGSSEIVWYNTHVNRGAHIAILIQYGHGTGTGGYVPGRDYINPAMRPIFDKILADIRRAVASG